MDLRRIIPTDITASAIAHLSLLTLLLLFSDVHPFGAVTAEPIPVEIVTPQELAETAGAPDEAACWSRSRRRRRSLISPCSTSRLLTAASSAGGRRRACRAAAEAGRARHAAPRPSRSRRSRIATGRRRPTSRPSRMSRSNIRCCSACRRISRPLPAAPAQARNKGDDNFDAPATEAADIASTLITAFRRHLKTCSKLPASLSSADDVKVKLRVLMTPDGRLAADPILIEASASMKGPLLMQGAIRALQACQPYAMLPADRYGEWKVLDLSFTPQDFTGG